MKKLKIITLVVKDIAEYPGGRFERHGSFSGQEFRQKHLVPALKENDVVQILLDNEVGYPGSFLEEAFGGLVRLEGFSKDDLRSKLKFISKNSKMTLFQEMALKFIRDAKPGEPKAD